MINNYEISVKPIHNSIYECLITPKSHTTTFGVLVHSQSPPTYPWVLHQFTTNFREFFINIDVSQDVAVVPPIPSLPSGSVSNP